MSNPTYWLSVFNAETWQEFLDAGGETLGFPHTQLKTVTRIEPGDYILAYMTKASSWFAIMEVTNEPYFDTETKIWKQALFPCRIKVNVKQALPIDQSIHTLTLAPKLKMFDNLKSPTYWGLLFRSAPKRLDSEDGKTITEAINGAAVLSD